jgi:hypothetical protein
MSTTKWLLLAILIMVPIVGALERDRKDSLSKMPPAERWLAECKHLASSYEVRECEYMYHHGIKEHLHEKQEG